MAESIPDEDLPSMSLPRKSVSSQEAAPEPVPAGVEQRS
jgi:hypothetical protein